MPDSKHWRVFGASMLLMTDVHGVCQGAWTVQDNSNDHMSSVTYVVCGSQKTICSTKWTAVSGSGAGGCNSGDEDVHYYDPGSDDWYTFSSSVGSHNNVSGKLGSNDVFRENTGGGCGGGTSTWDFVNYSANQNTFDTDPNVASGEVFKIRSTLTSKNGVYEDFSTITFLNGCYDDVLSISGGNQNIDVVAGTNKSFSSGTIVHNHIGTPTGNDSCGGCPVTELLEIYDPSINDWTSSTSNSFWNSVFNTGQSNSDCGTTNIQVQANSGTFSAASTQVRIRCTQTSKYSKQFQANKNTGSTFGLSRTAQNEMQITIYKLGTDLDCIGKSYTTAGTTTLSDFSYDVYANSASVSKTWDIVQPTGSGCSTNQVWSSLNTLDASGNWVTEAFSWASMSPLSTTNIATTATFTVQQQTQSDLYPLLSKQVAFKFSVSASTFSSITLEKTWIVTLNQGCADNVLSLTSAQHQADIYYLPLATPTTLPVSVFSYTKTKTVAQCPPTVLKMQVKNKLDGDWLDYNAAADVWVKPSTFVSSTLAFDIQASTSQVTYGNQVYVRRIVSDQYSGSSVEDLFTIYWISTCMSNTLSLMTSDVTSQTAVVGTSLTIASKLDTSSAGSCPYTATCQIFDSNKAAWVAATTFDAGITCSSTGAWTVNISSTSTIFDPSTILLAQVIYTSTESLVATTSNPSKQVIDQFYLTIQSKCLATTITYPDFADITHQLTSTTNSVNYSSPGFATTGSTNTVCPNTVKLELREDGSAQNWATWSGGSFTTKASSPITYTFISSLTNTGNLNGLGGFTISTTGRLFTPSKKFNARLTLTGNGSGKVVEVLFNITLVDTCSVNTFTISQPATVDYVIALSGTTAAISRTTSTVTGATTGCTLNYTLEVYDSALFAWVQVTTANVASKYTFLQYTSSTTTNAFSVQTTNFSTWGNTSTLLRQRVQDPNSLQVGGNVTSQLVVNISYVCSSDSLSINSANNIPDQLYYFGTASQNLQLPVVVQTQPGCPLTYLLQVYDQSKHLWVDYSSGSHGYFVKTFSATTGQISIENITGTKLITGDLLPSVQIGMRIVATSTSSTSLTSQAVIDEFTLKLASSVCLDNILTKTSELPDVVYTVFTAATSLTITPLYSTLKPTATCALTAKLYVLDDAANTWKDNALTPLSFITFNAASTASGAFSIQQTTRATYAPSTKFEIKVQISDLNSNKQVLEFQFTLELRDQCADDTLTLSSQIASYSYQIGSGDSTVNIMKPSFTHLYPGCQLDANLYFLDTKTGLYLNDNTGSTVSGSPYEFIKTFTALGELTINTSNNSKYGLKSDFLVKITLSLPWSSPSRSISYQFTITILNQCQNNSLMFTIANAQSNLKYYINSDFDGNASNTPDTTLTPTVTSTQTAATCPLQATLEVWNNSKHMWQTQTVSGWVQTFNTSTGALVISTTDFATYHPRTSPAFTDAWTTVDVRITLKDVNSNNVSNSASEIFTLQILRECSDVSITKGTNIPAITYFVGSGASTAIVPSFTIGQSGCKPDFRLWFFDAQSGEWTNTFPPAVSSFDITTGSLILNTSDFSYYNKPVVYQSKITAFNTVSNISFQFNITVKDKCYDNSVTTPIILKDGSGNQHTEVDPFVWDLWQYTTAKISDPVVSIAGCPTTFQITDIDTERTQIPVSTFKIVGATPTQTVEGVYRDTTKIGARYFYVRATIKNMNGDQVILTTETKYFVNFKNPCTRSSSIIASAIPDIDYWIKDTAFTQNVADYNDQASRDYGGIVRSDTNFSTTAKLCGTKSYSLYKKDSIQNILVVSSPFISLAQVGSNWVITVQTNDPQYYTNSFVDYLVKVSLDDYEVSHPKETIWWEPVKVQLKNCQVTSMTFPVVSNVDYNLYTPVIHIQMTQFTQVHQAPFSRSVGQQCGYTLTYTAKWLDYYGTIIDLPSFITWNAAQFRFEVQSSNLIDLTNLRQTYKLLLIASVSITDMSPVFSQTQQFTLNVNNGCLLDTSSVTTSISDYVYYINENTEFGTWTQGVLPKPKVHTFTTTYTQSVAGCPVDYKIYRTYADGSRKLITAYEQSVLSYTYPTINVTTLWASQSSLLPFTVVVTLTSADYAYDLQEWNLNVVQASTYSTTASREASTNFKLTLKDVCWDLPLSGIAIASVPVSEDIWEVFKLSYTTLTTQWGDYCGGFSYTMQYVSGPKVQGLITADKVDMMLVYSSVTQNNSALPGVPYMTATINDRSWIGNHVVKIVGQNGIIKKYKTYTTADFILKIVDPCERSVVSAQVITDMVFTIGPTQVSTKQYYNEFGDSMGLLYGDQYSKCGPRIHKLTQVGWLNYMTPSGSQLLQFLGFQSYPNGNPTLPFPSTPNAYGIFLNTDNTDYLGQRSMQLTVSLLNYPAATSAVVNFKIRIDPCVVTSYTAPAAMTISFFIGQTPMNAIFNFVQGSCSYPATYRAQLQSGQALPTFFSQNSRANYFNIRASNLANVGQYVVQIKATLDNILVQSSTTNTYLLPAQQINASSPPADYIYTNSFLLTINIYATSPGTQTNPNPFFSPVPYDTWVYVGDKFTQTYGKALDTANHVINVTVELGDAARFLSFDYSTNSISIQALKTTQADVNSYKLRITLATDQLTPVVTTYDFVLAIREKPNNLSKDQVLTDQRLTEVFKKYDNNVIDLRGFNQAEIYSNQYASQYLPTLQTTTVPVGGSSQQLRLTTYTAFTPDDTTKTPPQPFVKSISPDGILTIGFDQLMNVPTNLIELLKKQVAIRWLESTTETYLTPDGYRDFEIRPSLDIQVIPSPDSDPIKLGFNFDLVSFDNNELKVKLNFQLPEYVSSQGISKDQVMVTFWDNKSLTAVNGLPIPEGTTLTKPVVRLILDSLVANIDKISKQCAIAAVIIILVGLLITLLFDFDEAPFWSLFNTWQIISHLPLLNLNYSGFFTTFLRKQLDFMLLRIPSWQQLVYKTSKISMIDERSFSDAFETSGYPSMLLTINLSMPLAVIAVLIICLPLSWLIDKVVSVRDPLSRFGGRKQIFKKPLFSKTVNALLRCLMIVFLDLSICMLLNIFSWKQNYQVNAFGKLNACVVIISSCVIGLLFAFIWGQAIVYEVKKKKTKDVKIIGEYSTIYVGLNSYQPLRASTFNAVFFIRRFAIALAVVFLQEAPVTQLLILVLGSLFSMLSYGYFRPFNENYNAWLEYLNEWSIMLTTVMCIAFTDFVPEVDMKNKVAWYLIIFFLFIMIKNICFGFYSFWFIYHRRVLGFDNKVAAAAIVKDIKAPKTEVKISIISNDHPVVDQEVGEVKDPYHNPYGMFQINRPILGQNTYNVSSDGPSGWMSAHNDNENSSFSNQPPLLRPPDQTEIDVSQQEQMSVYGLYKVHTSTLRNLMNPSEQDVEVASFRQPLPNLNLQIEEEHWNNDLNIGVQDQQSEKEEEQKVSQLHQVYSDKFVGTNQIQSRNAIHRKGLSEDFGSFSKSGRSNGSLLIDQPLRPNQEINRKATQFQQNHAVYNNRSSFISILKPKGEEICPRALNSIGQEPLFNPKMKGKNHALTKPRINPQQNRLDMSYEQSKEVKSSLHIFDNPVRNSVETSFAVTPKANLQFYGRQNIDQASSNATIYQDPHKIASMARHRKVASFSDLSEPSARLNNIVMSRIERRQRNRVNGEQRQNTNSPPKVEKTYDSDDEDFKQFELGLANRTENVRNSHQRIKDKGMPKLSDRNIKPEHDILSMASSELNRLGKN